MNVDDARTLNQGDEICILDGVGRVSIGTGASFEAGPFTNGSGPSAKWVVLVRIAANGKLSLYNLTDLALKPPVPRVGETWIHRIDGHTRTKYVDGVTDRHVVLKANSGRPDNRAHIMSIEDFVKDFRKKP